MRRVDAGIAAVIAATILGTVPAVGGYSNTTTDSVHASAPEGGDFSTVGIVTQVLGGSFSVEAGKSAARTIEVGQGVQSGDRIWVEHKALVRITDTEGGRITVAGPASVEFVRKGRTHAVARIFKGSIKFRAAEGQVMRFENAFVAGTVAGEGAVWASADSVQVLGLTGDVKAWHPHLVQAAVLVTPGFFTESSLQFKHLQPKIPVRIDAEHFEHFLSRFEETHAPLEGAEEQKRGLASVDSREVAEAAALAEQAAVRVARSPAQFTEPTDADSIKRLRAHISGKDYEEQDEVPLAAPGPRFNAYGQRLKSRGLAGERHAPTWQVVEQSRKPLKDLDDEQRTLLKKLGKKPKIEASE